MSFSHFFALLNKNFIILKRTYILTSIEIISPILVILLFYIFKSLFKTENLDIYQDQNYIISNGTFIKDMAEGYNQYGEIDLIYRGIIYQCDDQSIALVGENFPKEIIDKLNSSRWETYNEQINFKHFKNVKDLFSYIENNNNEDDEICFGISYQKNIDKETNKVKYLFKLHYPASPYSKGSLIPSTNIDNLDTFRSQPDFSSYEKYIEGGFLSVQKLLYDYVLKKETNNPKAEIKYRLLPQKYEKYLYNIIDEYLNILLGFFFFFSYAFPLSINIYRLIKEKESKAKEIMKIMGLNELNYFLPYFIIYFIINLIYSIFNSLIISSSFDYIKTKYLFTFFFLFGLVIYSMVFFFRAGSGEIRVYRGGRLAAFAHCENDRGRAKNDVSAGVDAFYRRASLAVRDYAPARVRFETFGSRRDQRIRPVADGDDHGIHVYGEFAALHGHGAAAPGSVRFAEFVFQTLDSADLAVFAAEYPLGVLQHVEFHALRLRVADFLKTRGHFRLAAAVYEMDFVRPQPESHARGVHRHVPAAEHRHALSVPERRVRMFFIVRLHEVCASQILVCGKDAVEVLVCAASAPQGSWSRFSRLFRGDLRSRAPRSSWAAGIRGFRTQERRQVCGTPRTPSLRVPPGRSPPRRLWKRGRSRSRRRAFRWASQRRASAPAGVRPRFRRPPSPRRNAPRARSPQPCPGL